MNVTEINKANSSKKLIDFQQITCKEISKNSSDALTSLISNNPSLSSQFLRISMTKERLDLILIILKEYRCPDALKIITYLCKGMNRYDARQVSSIWNLLYSQDKSVFKYQIYYECLVSFPFGGGNREAQQTSLTVLYQLIQLLVRIEDNKILSRISQNYIQNFKKYNVLNISYLKVMNQIILISPSFEGYVKIDVYELLSRYITHLSQAKQKKWHNLEVEILKGITALGEVLFKSEYIMGSLFTLVFHHVEPYLQNQIFGVRDAAREAMKAWKLVERRVKEERKEKERVLNSENSELLDQSDEPRIRNMIDETGKYLVKKQYVEKKVFSELSSLASESAERKEFLKKKTGNGGGYIHLQGKPKPNLIKSKYEYILEGILAEKKYPQPKLLQRQVDWYPNNSHITQKYHLEQTVEYQKDEDLYLLGLMNNNKQASNVDIRQIEELIDVAYSKVWGP